MPGALGDRAGHHAGRARSWPASPKAIILSGGPASVYAEARRRCRPARLSCSSAGVPVLGICYGFQLMVTDLGGTVGAHRLRRVRRHPADPGPRQRRGDPQGGQRGDRAAGRPAPGRAVDGRAAAPQRLLGGALLAACRRPSRSGCRTGTPPPRAPPGFTVTARTAATPVAAMEDTGRGLYGVQFHPEVMHTEHGQAMLRRFLRAGRLPHRLDHGQHHRRAGRAGSGPRSARPGPSAACPAGWTPRSPRPSCSGPSAPS